MIQNISVASDLYLSDGIDRYVLSLVIDDIIYHLISK